MLLCKWRVSDLSSVLALFSEYKRQRIVSLWQDVCKAPTIAKTLAKENLPAIGQGVQKLLKKYKEYGAIGRREGAGQKTKNNC